MEKLRHVSRRQNLGAMYARKISAVLVLILCAQLFTISASAASAGVGGITSRGAIVMDFESGEVLFEHNADVRRAPASMTKMMTVYMVLDAVDRGVISLDTRVPISEFAHEFSRRPGETNVALTRTRHYTVSQLLDVSIIMSASGASVALAELVGNGSRHNFFRMMTARANYWGIDAVFHSASGGSTHTFMSPRAMAEITRNTILRFPEVLERTAMTSVTFHGRTYHSTNRLLGVYEGIDGFKTGSNSVALENFSGTAARGDVRIITVTMGSNWGRRFADTEILMNYGFNTMMERRMIPPTSSPILINGEIVEFEAYFIGGSNYFRIRDLAYALNGTASQFNVQWDSEFHAVALTSETAYIAVGGELSPGSGESVIPAVLNARIIFDGEEVALDAYNIGGSTFFRLRDIMTLVGAEVAFDSASGIISITA